MKKAELKDRMREHNPFINTHNTEWTCATKLAEWINNIIKEEHISLGQALVERILEGSRERPDITLFESPGSQKILCVIETKQPYFDPLDEEELIEPARKKATEVHAKYFATSNFQKLVWFSTEKTNSLKPLEEQILGKYSFSQIENLDHIERYENSIVSELNRFLVYLYEVHTGKKSEPRQPIDELLIFRLQEKIRILSLYYTAIIQELSHENKTFAEKLTKWFVSQGWSFAGQPQDLEKAARQTAYLLVNKILFYNILQAKRPQQLDPLEVPRDLTKGSLLQKILQDYFSEVLKIDYETIYTTDFIDTVAFPEEENVVREIKELIGILRRYDFSKLGDIIGPIFERLIPQKERHELGQYFTNPDIVDLILRFCLKHEADRVLDPACGAGTFLVRAYQHKKLMNQRLKHEDILDTLYGCDIAKFPAHLSTINLAIRDLSVEKNYPKISQKDFFSLIPSGSFEHFPISKKIKTKGLDTKEKEVTYPDWFDCIVGNPPYTRQEEISKIFPDIKKYKEELIDRALKDITGKKIAEIPKRAGIYAYFFIHGMKFLKNGGRFGFIVSNSWLDVDYGTRLQEIFLKNCKISAIIESKVERWFEEADVNTCIVILEKCNDKKERDENIVRFVYLFKPLKYFIPQAKERWEEQNERVKEIDELIKTIMFHSEFYQNEDLRIFPKLQKELWDEGFGDKKGKYVGAKWGKYLRAPQIFFKILEQGKDKLVKLGDIAEVRFGIKTGANEFFYLREEEIKRRGIEREFWMHQDENGNWIPNYVIKSPKECKSIVVKPEDLKYRVLMIHKDREDLKGTNVLKYIEEGESKGFHKRSTCARRGRWYELPKLPEADILFNQFFNERFLFPWNREHYLVDHAYYYILYPKNTEKLVLVLNSVVNFFMVELYGRTGLGQGALQTYAPEMKSLIILNPNNLQINQGKIRKILQKYSKYSSKSVFEELGINLDKPIKEQEPKPLPERAELDKLIFDEIGLTEEERLEVYRAVVDLVKSRIEKAKSFGKKPKRMKGIDIDLLVKSVIDELGDETLGKFYREKILTHESLRTITLHKIPDDIDIGQGLFGWQVILGKERIDCKSKNEAIYLKLLLEAGFEEIKIPKDEGYLEQIIPELKRLKQKADAVFEGHLSSILDPKLREHILHQLWLNAIK